MVGAQALQSALKYYVNVINATTSLNKPTPQPIVITNETILSQNRIKQGLKILGKYMGNTQFRKNFESFMIAESLKKNPSGINP